MIKKNMLTMKELQKELEAIKNERNTANLGSSSKPIYKQGYSIILFLFTTLISYGHKLPMVSKLITLLSLWYGRTTWWKMLISLRKIFVIINAFIGLYTVLTVTGFSSDNLAAGVAIMGHTYFEMVYSGISRLLKWIYSFFDYITPEAPKPPTNFSWGGGPREHTWATRPMNKDSFGKIMELAKTQDFYNPYKSTTNDWSIPSWLWYAGIAIISVGVLYLGYSLISNGTIAEIIAPTNKTNVNNPTNPPTIPPTNPPTNPNTIDITKDGSLFTTIGARINNVINPFKWFRTDAQVKDQFTAFMDQQYNPAQADLRYYPFTVENPYDSWFKKLTTSIFGESKGDATRRLKDQLYATNEYDLIKVNRTLLGVHTPSVANIGLGTQSPFNPTIWDRIHESNVHTAISKIPTTPNIQSLDIPDVVEWRNHVINKNIPVEEIASTSKVTTETLDKIIKAHHNRYIVLTEENI